MSKVIVVSSNKGGCLKTSLTVNVAGVLAKQGKKVLIIDIDNQANVSLSFGKNPDAFENTIYDVLVKDFPIEETLVEVHENIYICPSNDDLAHFERDIIKKEDKYENIFLLLKKAVDKVKDSFDFILIDTPPNFGLLVSNSFMCSDENISVLVPFHPEIYSVRSIIKTIQTIENFKKENPNLTIEAVVPTKVKNKTKNHGANLNACIQYCNTQRIKVTDAFIRETVKYPDAIASHRLPLTLVEGEEKNAEDYIQLVKELSL